MGLKFASIRNQSDAKQRMDLRMKRFQKALLALTIVITMECFCSCNNPSPVDTKEDYMEVVLATEEELLEYYSSIGLTEQDLADIDIEDLINEYSIPSGNLEALRPERFLDSYRLRKANQERGKILATEIISVDSTDAEYESFLKAYLAAIDGETIDVNYYDNLYNFMAGNGWQSSIGRTKDIENFDVRLDEGSGFYYIDIPSGELTMSSTFCYSADKKFFLLTYVFSNTIENDFIYEYSLIFTQTKS